MNDLTGFVNPGKIIGSGFPNPVISQNSGFPNPVYFPFTGYHKSGNNTPIIQPSSMTNFLICKINIVSLGYHGDTKLMA